MIWNRLEKYRDLGLLILRLGIGIDFIWLHGWGKLMGGPDKWVNYGDVMAQLGLDFFPAFWGFMAAFSETFVALFFAIGLFFRPSSAILAFTMLVAVFAHISGGDPWTAASHALKMVFVFGAFIAIGPGRYSLDKKLFKSRS